MIKKSHQLHAFKLTASILTIWTLTACYPLATTKYFGASLDAAKSVAATNTAKNNSVCVSIAPFYWEIGSAGGAKANGSTGDGSISASTPMSVGSASKWFFAAYVMQKRAGTLTATDKSALQMTSGYTNAMPLNCVGTTSILECSNTGSNDLLTSSNVNSFYYNDGHMQRWANTNGLSGMFGESLSNEILAQLGVGVALNYTFPNVSTGLYTEPRYYAAFLMKLLGKELLLGLNLGIDPICTLPSGTCTTSQYSPLTVDFKYSYGHWIEDDPSSDGSFSSPGLFGFYPWISADKTQYGILARANYGPLSEMGEGMSSQQCAYRIRTAYNTGVEVTN